MPNKMPPVPRDNRSPKGPGSNAPAPKDVEPHDDTSPNLEQQKRYGNINQNTHNVGYQQDR
jgi:hypothetical protein